MDEFQINPDEIIYLDWGWLQLNATLLNTWIAMAVLVGGAWSAGKRITNKPHVSKLQTLIEIVFESIRIQIQEISQSSASPFIPFVGTLFLLVATGTILAIIPGIQSPMASLSTTAALASCVFFAVPVFGIRTQGVSDYIRQYVRPTWLMLPFNVISELSRTLALAVRLYGNMMSGAVIAAVLLTFVPLFIPVVMQLFGLITGMIQAYIFAVLAMVYIASASAANRQITLQSPDQISGTNAAPQNTI